MIQMLRNAILWLQRKRVRKMRVPFMVGVRKGDAVWFPDGEMGTVSEVLPDSINVVVRKGKRLPRVKAENNGANNATA